MPYCVMVIAECPSNCHKYFTGNRIKTSNKHKICELTLYCRSTPECSWQHATFVIQMTSNAVKLLKKILTLLKILKF